MNPNLKLVSEFKSLILFNNMKTILSIFLLITTISFSQNSNSYMATEIQNKLYEHFNSLGVTRLIGDSDCDCGIKSETIVIFTLNREDDNMIKTQDVDEYVLTDNISDDTPSKYVVYEIKYFKNNESKIQSIYIKVDIKRVKIRFNPFIFKHQVKYKVIVTYTYNIKH